jgi:hypothetical protein
MPQNEDEFDAGKNPRPQPAPLPYPARIEEELSITTNGSYRLCKAYKLQGKSGAMDAYTCRYVGAAFEAAPPMLRRISELPESNFRREVSYTLADGQIRCGGQSVGWAAATLSRIKGEYQRYPSGNPLRAGEARRPTADPRDS